MCVDVQHCCDTVGELAVACLRCVLGCIHLIIYFSVLQQCHAGGRRLAAASGDSVRVARGLRLPLCALEYCLSCGNTRPVCQSSSFFSLYSSTCSPPGPSENSNGPTDAAGGWEKHTQSRAKRVTSGYSKGTHLSGAGPFPAHFAARISRLIARAAELRSS